ncbi:hypothetical protein DF196_06805 [Bifidobacterium callitrichidarum]|uniref:Uncharacterized protein n=1 Tax=Bifidobacterium callitrichidarum TaxID=2052941 RepID=A0A2U2N8Z2_9BIFI|nr:hypothetical protein DF196_06805 [Bifidobacterium callitrichidarum]
MSSTELSTYILHRGTGIDDPIGTGKTMCTCGRWFYCPDWHLHGCWTNSRAQYDDPPLSRTDREVFLRFCLFGCLLEASGVLAPIRYEFERGLESRKRFL